MYSNTVLHEGYPFTYNIPGIVATIALIMMNLVSRDDLANMGDAFSSDEGSEVRRVPSCLRAEDACIYVHADFRGATWLKDAFYAGTRKAMAVPLLLHSFWCCSWQVCNQKSPTESCFCAVLDP